MAKAPICNTTCTISCSNGTIKNALSVQTTTGLALKIAGQPAVTAADLIPVANIPNFGGCTATPDKLCVPTVASWDSPATKLKVGGQAVLTDGSTASCTKGGGTITFTKPAPTKSTTA